MDAVTGAMANLAPKLLELLQEEYRLQTGLREQIESVSKELESIHAALGKVADVPSDQLDEQSKIWARDVREASFDMEDVLDSFLLRAGGRARDPPADTGRLRRALKKMAHLFSKAKARRDIAGTIGNIKKQLKEASERRIRYRIDDTVAKPAASSSTVDPRLSALYTQASRLVGVDEPRDALIKMLSLGDTDVADKKLKVVSVVGAGGFGKTTLVKAVYDKLKPQFDCGAFVPVGRNPDLKKVLRDVLIGLDKERFTKFDLLILDERQLIDELREFLLSKWYIIVIDDLWNTSTWNVITNALVANDHGSRIITTTRDIEVGNQIGEVYKLKKLSYNHSRKLFYTSVFGHEDGFPDDDELANVSDEIIKRCDGVPLAINTVASLLATKPVKDWSNIYHSIGFSCDDNIIVKNMIKILSFSYYDIPFYQRSCLLYLSIFPEDHAIEKNMLIWRWIAEGLVHKEEGTSLFEVGDRYFHDLINRSMILPIEMEGHGLIYGCRVHDMILHLIRELSSKQNFVSVIGSGQATFPQRGKVRRLSIQGIEKEQYVEANIMHMHQMRSFNAMWCPMSMIPTLCIFQVLRVLALEGCRGMEGYSVESIGNIRQLRYLGLTYTPTSELPEEIGRLNFLEALNLEKTGIKELPESMSQHTQLMCLFADENTRVPRWIGNLTSMQQLEMYPGDSNESTRLFVEELSKLTELRVLRTRINLMDCQPAKGLLHSLFNLKKLQVVLFDFCGQLPKMVPVPSLQREGFSRHLRSLRVLCFEFPCLPLWINPRDVPNLCDLWLFLSDVDQHDLDILGEFRELTSLNLVYRVWELPIKKETSNLTCSGGAFQNLRHCNISSLLNFMPGAMPRLETLDFRLALPTMYDAFASGGHITKKFEFGFQNLPSLQRVTALVICSNAASTRRAVATEDELRQAINIHPNRPTLRLLRNAQPDMPIEDEDERFGIRKIRWLVRRYDVKRKIVRQAPFVLPRPSQRFKENEDSDNIEFKDHDEEYHEETDVDVDDFLINSHDD